MSNSEDIAIKVSNVSKTFKLPHEKKNSVKSLFVSMFHGKRTYEKQKVLNDISFEIKKGEFFGIVGRNGSGKSTLLKLLAGIYSPDSGHIQVNGKLTPFIELGVGFNPELTGRENVFLNGALLGFNRKEMEAMYEEIVEFAELEKFMDQKLKNYSSGMQVRLAFSIAIRAKSDILLVDEVLAVGDAAFQRKCYEYFLHLKKEERTVILVTHDMSAVEKFCTKVMVIHEGESRGELSPRRAASTYEKLNAVKATGDTKTDSELRWGNGRATIKNVKVNDKSPHGVSVTVGKQLKISFDVISDENEDVVVGLAFFNESSNNLAGPNSIGEAIKTNGRVTYSISKTAFSPGSYSLVAAVFDKDAITEYDHIERAATFVIKSEKPVFGMTEPFGVWSYEDDKK